MIRIGCGFDVHALVAGRRLVLGGVAIDSDKGLAGHSDADALAHAMCDALLGALALGDMGGHFPDDSPDFKDADSMQLLAQTAAKVRAAGGRIVNMDASVALQQPKIAPHIAAMRENVAVAAGVTVGQVSVKATTAEKLGFIGRREGAAVFAVALVEVA